MQLKTIFASAVLVIAASSIFNTASAEEVLTGDTRLACEAILCLAAPHRPDECMPSLTKYFSISYKKIWDTIKARGDFLKLCPKGNGDQKMESLVDAMANGAGRCNAKDFNREMIYQVGNPEYGVFAISSQMPAYCKAYQGHEYSRIADIMPKYVGKEDDGGYWVDPDDYEQALKEYNARRNITFGDQ